MSFETLKQAIEAEAAAHIKTIEAAALAARQREEQRIKERARQLEERIVDAAEHDGTRAAQQLHQEHQLEVKARVLTAKQEELTRLEEVLAEHVLAQDSVTCERLLKALLALLPADLDGTITAGERHVETLKELLKKGSRKLTLTDSTVPDDGGFVFASPTVELNLTVRQLVRQLVIRHRAELAQRLFS